MCWVWIIMGGRYIHTWLAIAPTATSPPPPQQTNPNPIITTRASRLVGCYVMEGVGTFLLALTVALSLTEGANAPPAPATAGLMLSGLVRGASGREERWQKEGRRAARRALIRSCKQTPFFLSSPQQPPSPLFPDTHTHTFPGLRRGVPLRLPPQPRRDAGRAPVPPKRQGSAQGRRLRGGAGEMTRRGDETRMAATSLFNLLGDADASFGGGGWPHGPSQKGRSTQGPNPPFTKR